MCRIFGNLAAGAGGGGAAARPDAAELAAVSARQRHGGPDEHHVLSGAGWSLGCDRLAVTEPCGGQQPYRLPHLPGILAVLNGELYNHTELRLHLAARGHRFPDRCDGTVLPALYAEYGPAFAEHLEGMFAVAVLDLRPGRTQLVLAVDDMGMKPVHWHHDPADGTTRFASEIPALLAFEGVRIAPREDSLDTVLATRTSFSSRTALDGIEVLAPGATAVVRPGCRPLVRRRAPHRATAGDSSTQDVLRREVRRLAESELPVCAITSGGLDSGLVTALAAEYARETDAPPLHTFHLTYRGRWPDSEAAHARSVARRARTVHHEVALDPDEFGSLLTRTVRHLGQPNADPIALSTYALFRAVREAGFTVALAGDGADELFGGYERMRTALETPEWVPAYVDALSAAPRLLREHLYTPAYRAYIAEHGSAADRIEQELRACGPDRATALTAFETRWRLPAYHLRRVDHLSMAWAVETRLPFCQPGVVAHARALPPGALRGKRALYEAGRELLPPSVLARPKQPFTLPVAAMLTPGSPLLDTVRELLSPARLVLGGKLRADRVRGLLARQLERPNQRDAQALWALAVHELWTDVVQGMRIPVGCVA